MPDPRLSTEDLTRIKAQWGPYGGTVGGAEINDLLAEICALQGDSILERERGNLWKERAEQAEAAVAALNCNHSATRLLDYVGHDICWCLKCGALREGGAAWELPNHA